MLIGFDLDSDGQTAKEISVGAEHITESQVRLGPMSFEKRLDPRLYFCREDGQQVGMTFFPEQKVVAFSRRTTQGTFESQAVIPTAGGGPDQVWTISKRTINGQVKRFVEVFEFNQELLQTRAWTSLQTDCAIVLTGQTGNTLTGLGHLEGATVDVVKNGVFLGPKVVAAAAIILTDPLVLADVVEVGLHYDSTMTTMQPSIPGTVIEGMPRSWESLFVRMKDSRGGKINGQAIRYPPTDLDTPNLHTGDLRVTTEGWDTAGKVTLLQDQPFPFTALALFGDLHIGEHA